MTSTTSTLTQPRRRDLLVAWMARHRYLLQLLGLLIIAAALLTATYMLFPRTETDTFGREVVAAALGAVITVITAGIAAAGPIIRLLHERRQAAAQRHFDRHTHRRSAIQVGRMQIPDIMVVASANVGREWTDVIDLTFTDFGARRPDPPEMEALRTRRLPELRRNAEARGVTLTDDPCVDLVGATVRMQPDGRGKRRPTYELTPATATYFDFALTTANLDVPLPEVLDDERTLRQHWDVHPTAIEHVADLPAMAKVGVTAVVVTSDDYLVLGVRGKTFIAGSHESDGARSGVHVVAEGMIPTDVDRRGFIDPAVTARRGLREELNIGDPVHAHGRIEDLHAVGFFFDQKRWQPCFTYLARIDLSWDELQTLVPTAESYWEVERLVALPFTIENPEVCALMIGDHPDLVLASNHAASALWFALLHQHGLFAMRTELTLGSALSRGSARA